MLFNYLLTSFRVLWKDRLYTFINIIGLGVGLAGFMLIVIFISGELSYDRHHKDGNRIYRVAMDLTMSGKTTRAAVSGGILGKLMHDEIKGVESYTRFVHNPREILLGVGERKIYVEDILYADSSFFRFFDYKIIAGDADEALREPYSLVLTNSTASKLFGSEDPMGKAITWNGNDTYIVRAVIEDPEYPSHIKCEGLASLATLENIPPFDRYINILYAFVMHNYVKLYPGFGPEDIKAPLDSLVAKHMAEGIEESGAEFNFYLQPIRDIYLHSDLRHELRANGNINNLYIFIGVALFTLLIACINFITLATSRSVRRDREVGVRKVFGASRKSLIGQFLIESIIMSLAGMLVAIILIELLIPRIELIAGSDLSIILGEFSEYFIYLFSLSIIVGLLSGLYPAVALSSSNPLGIMQKRISKGKRASWFRNAMVVMQFVITIFMICGTIIISLQLDYMRNRDLGIDLENKVIIQLRGRTMIDKYEDLKASLMSIKGIEAVTASSNYPGNFNRRQAYYPEGSTRNDMWMLLNVLVAHNYFDVMGIDLIAGKGFSDNPAVDSLNVIVNEALVAEAGWDDPLGKYIGIPLDNESDDIKLKVIGVAADFNYSSLHESIKPLLIMHDPQLFSFVCFQVDAASMSSSLAMAEQEWDEIFPGQPFSYMILKNEFESSYLSESKLSEVFVWFTLLAIFVACMGLFGLSSFMVTQRTREIGIRKVLGANNSQLVYLFVKGFAMLVLIAAIVAIPLSWYAMSIWLQNFAHQTPVYWWLFPIAVFLALMVATLTVLFQSMKAANMDPVESIRWE